MKRKYNYSGPVSSINKMCLVTGMEVELDSDDKRTQQLIKLGCLKEVVLDSATEKKPAAPVKNKKQ
ncbi:MAG: hypothetical protein ACOX2F_07235 [bacterium]